MPKLALGRQLTDVHGKSPVGDQKLPSRKHTCPHKKQPRLQSTKARQSAGSGPLLGSAGCVP